MTKRKNTSATKPPEAIGRTFKKQKKRIIKKLLPPYDRYVVSNKGEIGSFVYTKSGINQVRWLSVTSGWCESINKQKTLRLYSSKEQKEKTIFLVTTSTLVVQYFIFRSYVPKERKHYVHHVDGNVNNNCVENIRVYPISAIAYFLEQNTKSAGVRNRKPVYCKTTDTNFVSVNSVFRKYPKISYYKLLRNLHGRTSDIGGLSFKWGAQ